MGSLLSRIVCLRSLHQPPPLIQPGTCHHRISWLTAMQPLLCWKQKSKLQKPTKQGEVCPCLWVAHCFCPVTAILAYFAVRGTSPGPLFLLKDGTTLTRQKLVKMVQSALQLAGIDPSGYSGHRTSDQNQTIP